MTNTFDEMLAIIQAAKEGKPIQTRLKVGGTWLDFDGDRFDFVNYEHRVKQTPVHPGDLTWEEARKLYEEGVKVQWSWPGSVTWIDCDGCRFGKTSPTAAHQSHAKSSWGRKMFRRGQQ